MRSELGKMELDKTFEERDQLNTNIVTSINEASGPWGIQVLRYEIKDIVPPNSVMEAMEAQMKAERVKRAQILESEGDRQAAINRAEGAKQSVVLAAEADKAEQVLKAEGEAQAILAVAEAQAEALRKVGEAADTEEGQKAIQLDLATKAIEAKQAIVRIRHFPITNSGLSITPILIHPITGIMACPISSCGRPQSATGIYLMVCCFLIDSPVRVIR